MEQPPFPSIPDIPANDSPAPATSTTSQDASATPSQPSASAPLPPMPPASPRVSQAEAAPVTEAQTEGKATPEAETVPEAGATPESGATPKPQAVSTDGATGGEAPDIPLATGSLSEILAAMSSAATPLEEASAATEATTDQEAKKEEETPAEKAAPSRPYPDILLQPLPRQDPLRFKWHLGHGLPSVAQIASNEGDTPEEESEATADAAPQPGFLRLYGLLNSGEPWEARLNFTELEQARDGIYIGRDPSVCRIVIPEESVSRRHAKLELAPKGLVITDQGSRNGVYVNGQQLAIYENQTPINDGDTLSLGDASLRVEINT